MNRGQAKYSIVAVVLATLQYLWIPLLLWAEENPASSDTLQQDFGKFRQSALTLFPILMYDSDVGLGFGGKGVLINQLNHSESFDLTLFGSSRGEQWYAFTFSMPDYELRQGAAYAGAMDLKIEFNKILKSNFFGFGNDSPDNEEQFPRESFNLALLLSRAFTPRIIAEITLSYSHASVYRFEHNPEITPDTPGAGKNLVSYPSISLRWDSRDSRIHPRQGWRVNAGADFATKLLGGDFNFQRYRLEASKYQKLFNRHHILAGRLWTQQVKGPTPYYMQSSLGGGWTLRGFKADRFIDRASILASAEYRFKIVKRFGGVLLVDSGRVFSSIWKANFQNWKFNWGWGLRYYLANFLVRFDAGFSNQGTRIFFNFGQVF